MCRALQQTNAMNIKYVMLFAVSGVFGMGSVVQAQIRAFTNDNGSVIQAELVSHNGGKVTLRRADGKEFTVDPAIFSREDEDQIRTWMAKTPAAVNYNLKIVADKKKIEGSNRNFGYKRVKNDLWSYLVTLTNGSQDTVSNLKIMYRVFYTDSADGAYSATSDRLYYKMIEGTEKLESELAFNRTFQFTTKPVQIDVVDYDYGNRYKDEIKGCLIRIVNQTGDVVLDWRSPDVGMKNKSWSNTNSRTKDANPVIVR